MDFETLRVLDLFAGTGSISYEFISRGCVQVTAVDLDPQCIRFISKMAGELRTDGLMAIRSDVFRFVKHPGTSYNLVFADPPYDLDDLDSMPALMLNSPVLEPDSLFILEHSRHFDFSDLAEFLDHRKYGNVHFTFFRKGKEKED